MKKVSVVAMVVMVGLLCTVAFGWAQAQAPGPRAATGQIDVKAFREFQKETLPLRDELMAKRVEVRNEYAQEKPNLERIGTLQKEMIDLRTKIQTAAEKQGLSGWGPGAGWGRGAGKGCGAGWGQGCGMHGRGDGWGPGSGMMGRGGWRGAGNGSGPCPMSK